MRREFIFLWDEREIILPVTPASYEVEIGKNIEVVNIYELGDVPLAGYQTFAGVKINCLLPYHSYSFSNGDEDQDFYLDVFSQMAKSQKKVRFIVSNTRVNQEGFVQSFSHGEKDGTNDVYGLITFRESPRLSPIISISSSSAAASLPNRPPPPQQSGVTLYTAVWGDTLCSICRRFYGNDKPDTYKRLAKYNGKPNPNLLMTGEVLKIPKPLP